MVTYSSGAHHEKCFDLYCVPIEQHVGDILNKDSSVKPISDWDTTKLTPFQHSLAANGLFLSTYRLFS